MRSYLSLLLVTAILSLSVEASTAKHRMIPTAQVIEEAQIRNERANLQAFIKEQKVQKELIKLGVNPKEVELRIAGLSQIEISKLSEQIEKARAGGDSGIGTLVGAAVFIFIVLLITDILGFTKVFPFTRSI